MATYSGVLSGKSHGQRNLVCYSPWGHRVGYDLATKQKQGEKMRMISVCVDMQISICRYR